MSESEFEALAGFVYGFVRSSGSKERVTVRVDFKADELMVLCGGEIALQKPISELEEEIREVFA